MICTVCSSKQQRHCSCHLPRTCSCPVDQQCQCRQQQQPSRSVSSRHVQRQPQTQHTQQAQPYQLTYQNPVTASAQHHYQHQQHHPHHSPVQTHQRPPISFRKTPSSRSAPIRAPAVYVEPKGRRHRGHRSSRSNKLSQSPPEDNELARLSSRIQSNVVPYTTTGLASTYRGRRKLARRSSKSTEFGMGSVEKALSSISRTNENGGHVSLRDVDSSHALLRRNGRSIDFERMSRSSRDSLVSGSSEATSPRVLKVPPARPYVSDTSSRPSSGSSSDSYASQARYLPSLQWCNPNFVEP